MPKEKSANPVAAHHKAEKARQLKKNKAQVAQQRNERLSKRNPERLQSQIDDLQAEKEAQGGTLRPRDQQQLEQLERDVRAIRKAREAAGVPDRPPRRDGDARGPRGPRGPRDGHVLGKRRRDGGDDGQSDSEDTDPEVRNIPMPRDTPPPIPPKWLRKKNRQHHPGVAPAVGDAKPQSAPKTTYSAAPVMRDLQKEATSRFIPAAVAARNKQRQAALGLGHESKLLEPEELDRLEQEARADASHVADEAAKEEAHLLMANDAGADIDLEAEEAAFERELRAHEASGSTAPAHVVTMEEVDDEGD